jgi:ssDNA-binding Zn-finger/Zn-ribbon topoisomerase 1
MKVSDFDVDFSQGGLYNCCMEDVMARENEDAHEGMVIECNECGESMVLRKAKNGKLMWCSNRER